MPRLSAALAAAALLASPACQLESDRATGAASTSTPRIDSISPSRPRPGGLVKIRGTGFGSLRGAARLRVASQPFNDRPIVLEWSDTAIVARLDRHLLGEAAISVVDAAGSASRAVAVKLELACPPVPELETVLDVGSTDAEAFDVIGSTRCEIAVGGRAGKAGFFLIADQQGAPLPGFPVQHSEVAEWRHVSRTIEGFALVGTSPSGDIVLAEVDEKGGYLDGWPRVTRTRTADHVTGAARAAGAVAVVGTRGEASFAATFDVAGELMSFEILDDDFLGRHHALGVTATSQGFAVVGDRTRVTPYGTQDEGWIAELSPTGELAGARYLSSTPRLSAAASLGDDQVMAVGGDGTGRTALFSIPDAYPEFEYDIPAATHLVDAEPVALGVVAAGRDRSDAVLVRTNCAGSMTDGLAVDMGGEERFEAVTALYDGPAATDARAYLAVGSRRTGKERAPILVRRDAFPVQRPVVSFAVENGPDTEATLGESVSLTWSVADAWRYELRKVRGPGPDPQSGGALLYGDPVSGSETLSFDTAALAACAADGCAATTYELIASGPPAGRCTSGLTTRATVSVFFAGQEKWRQLVQSSAVIMEKYGSFTTAWPPIVPNHIDVTGPYGPYDRCLSQLGIPYGTVDAARLAVPPVPGSAAVLDDRAPGLVTYHSDAEGRPTTIAMIALGTWFTQQRPTLEGSDYVAASDWAGHWGGWHTGEGGMTIVTPEEPGPGVIADWRVPPMVPPLECGSRIDGCGALNPPVWHPALWDVHIYYPLDGSLPRVVFTAAEGGLTDPCAALTSSSPVQPLAGCDTGDPSLELNPFFDVDAAGNPVPKPCP